MLTIEEMEQHREALKSVLHTYATFRERPLNATLVLEFALGVEELIVNSKSDTFSEVGLMEPVLLLEIAAEMEEDEAQVCL